MRGGGLNRKDIFYNGILIYSILKSTFNSYKNQNNCEYSERGEKIKLSD